MIQLPSTQPRSRTAGVVSLLSEALFEISRLRDDVRCFADTAADAPRFLSRLYDLETQALWLIDRFDPSPAAH